MEIYEECSVSENMLMSAAENPQEEDILRFYLVYEVVHSFKNNLVKFISVRQLNFHV